jgi:hypothetical protein
MAHWAAWPLLPQRYPCVNMAELPDLWIQSKQELEGAVCWGGTSTDRPGSPGFKVLFMAVLGG